MSETKSYYRTKSGQLVSNGLLLRARWDDDDAHADGDDPIEILAFPLCRTPDGEIDFFTSERVGPVEMDEADLLLESANANWLGNGDYRCEWGVVE